MQTPSRSSTWKAAAWIVAGIGFIAAHSADGDSSQRAATPVTERGEQLYQQQCAVCHGATGAGDGPAAYLLSPAPRDFTAGRFRLATTQNGVPSDDDLVATLRRGMPGSAMPPFEWLSDADQRSLALHVRKLAIEGKARALLERAREEEEDLSVEEAGDIARRFMTPGAPLDPGVQPEIDAIALQQGRRVFLKTCALCHGADGTGRGAKDQQNEDGTPTQPRDFTSGIFKGGSTQRDIVMRMRGGMAGSPMPAMSFDDPAQAWAVAAYVESLVKPGAQERVAQQRQTIRVKRVQGELPRDAASAAWSQAVPIWLAVTPLWWRDERIEGCVVRALHDGREIALSFSWEDPTRDAELLGQELFSDAAALQLAAAGDAPLFTMGAKGAPVNIWQWKAAWELDLDRVRDIADLRPHTPPDAYGFVAQADEPLYLTARAVGNGQAAGVRDTAGDVLVAEGFGTLAPLAPAIPGFAARGAWSDGFWDVVLTRSLQARGQGEIALTPGGRVYVACALFDGAHQDRNGQKSVTVWHVLELEP